MRCKQTKSAHALDRKEECSAETERAQPCLARPCLRARATSADQRDPRRANRDRGRKQGSLHARWSDHTCESGADSVSAIIEGQTVFLDADASTRHVLVDKVGLDELDRERRLSDSTAADDDELVLAQELSLREGVRAELSVRSGLAGYPLRGVWSCGCRTRCERASERVSGRGDLRVGEGASGVVRRPRGGRGSGDSPWTWRLEASVRPSEVAVPRLAALGGVMSARTLVWDPAGLLSPRSPLPKTRVNQPPHAPSRGRSTDTSRPRSPISQL